ncbi:MAG: outer membrane beta-barrel protein [Gammaproteobacteria bacterium]|nr:outer membrane beta-barrel protein [Gammaproteobacteria bacterium]
MPSLATSAASDSGNIANADIVIKNLQQARLHLYVFHLGEPVGGVVLTRVLSQSNIKTDLNQGYTNENGALHLQLPPEHTQLELRHDGRRLAQLDLSLNAGESIEVIVDLPADDGPARVTVESSHQGRKMKPTGDTDTDEDTGDNTALTASARIEGVVTSLQGGNPVPGAEVFISGIAQQLRTDDEGHFLMQVTPGLYSLSVMHPNFSTQVFDEFSVNKNGYWQRDIELTPSAIDLDEYIVTAPDLEGGFAALADEQRNTSAVMEVIGADQMSNAGDSDAAGALKRITGLTVVGGKYVYVRGLGERYSSTTLNGAGLPSPDPTRRAVPLDLFPVGMLGSIAIQKTYSPDMPGEFGGGAVQLRTRGLPEEKFTNVSVSLQANSLTTGQQGQMYDGGDTDFLGTDDGTRAFPATLDRLTEGGAGLLTGLTPEEVEAAGESLPRNYATRDKTLLPDVSFKFNRGDRFESYGNNRGWGYLVSLLYRNQWQQRDEKRTTYGLTGRGGLTPLDNVNMTVTQNEIDLGGMAHLSLELGNDNMLESTTLLSRKTTNTVEQQNVYFSENDINARDTTLEWVEQQLFLEQLHGKHVLPRWNDLEIDWLASYSSATRDEPGTRFYRYEQRSDGRWGFSEGGQSNETSYEYLEDINSGLKLDFTLPIYELFAGLGNGSGTLKFGLQQETKDRDSSISRFRFLTDFSRNNINTGDLVTNSPEEVLTPENIGPDGYQLRNTTLPTDNYTAGQTITAQYFMGEANFEQFKWMLGARVESSNQQVTTFKLTNPNEKTVASLNTTDVLPGASMTWLMSSDTQLRLAYGRTVNRPDFKELSEAPYLDPETRRVVIGNPLLERALITHYDLRWEWYLTRFESLSMALFYKDFEKPIERVIRLGAGGIRTFANADSATNYGVEFQGRIWLSRLFSKKLSRFYIDGNLSLVESKVQLGNAGAQQTSQNRALQGQSPWVINMTLGYENLVSRTKASLLFNMAGERITNVGVKGLPDAYEQPVPQLDAVYSKTFYEGVRGDKWKLKLRLKNILDPKIKTLRGGEVERLTRKGRSFKVSLQYKFPS